MGVDRSEHAVFAGGGGSYGTNCGSATASVSRPDEQTQRATRVANMCVRDPLLRSEVGGCVLIKVGW